MAIAGRVAIVPKGDWSADATYKRLDAVTYNNTLYFAKKEVPAGTATSNTEYWSKSIVGGAGAIATKEDAGIVKPADGLSIAEDGTLKVSIDGTTLTMDQVNNVIKLADTLKDKIGSALQPESIVNNQVTTETGYALDARQANPNLDGTLAKQISDLNGSLNDFLRGVNGTYDIPGAFMMGFGGMSVAAPISDALRNKTITINKCRVQESASEIELPGSSTVFKYPSILLLVHNGITERYTGHFAVFTVTVS